MFESIAIHYWGVMGLISIAVVLLPSAIMAGLAVWDIRRMRRQRPALRVVK